MNLRERHSHTFRDPHKTERCDAAQLIAAGDALVEEAGAGGYGYCEATDHREACHLPDCAACNFRGALARWKKVTDGR